MKQGWECPKCGRVYAPWVPECEACAPQPSMQDNHSAMKPWPDISPWEVPYTAPIPPRADGYTITATSGGEQ